MNAMPEKMIARELKRGTLEMILLKLLTRRPMYGYELISTLEQEGGQIFQLKEGTLYPVLYRLENSGYIQAQWETLDRGVPRKYYRLTDPGIQEMEALIAEWQEFQAAVETLLRTEGKDEHH
jgi:PadR family transcriptional regulator PadR